MSEFADQLIALNIPRSALELVVISNWIVAFVSFWIMAVLWVLLPFKLAPETKRDWLMMLPLIVFLPGSLFTPSGRLIRAWLVLVTILFVSMVIVGITVGMALQQLPVQMT